MTDQQLPDAELDVMTCLWHGGSMTARQVREALRDQRPMAHASVCTLLGRLEAKGLVSREKAPVGKAFVYTAAVQPSATRGRLLGDLLDRFFGGSGVALVSSLLESRPPTSAEIVELESLLREMQNETAQRPRKKRKAPRKKRKRP